MKRQCRELNQTAVEEDSVPAAAAATLKNDTGVGLPVWGSSSSSSSSSAAVGITMRNETIRQGDIGRRLDGGGETSGKRPPCCSSSWIRPFLC